ncbi:MAG: VOC family protein [Acidobacteriia bacterium]|nr:VOC family protein [Terriglobia bacterium]
MSSIRPTKFAHVVYRTRRFEQMLRWYETVFDAKIQYQNPALAFLTFDDEHHRFAFANLSLFQPDGTETDRQGAIGVDHVGYTYASLNDLLENYARLKERGISPYWCIHHGFTVSMYYADPDGNQIELQVDSYSSSEDANAFMHGPHFSANPLGIEYDPEELLARLRAGAPVSDFLLRQVHEPVPPLRGAISKLVAAP